MTDASQLAGGRFAQGFNCAQSIFSTFSEQLGLSTDVALRLAAPFGAGLGRAGEVCGALSGALLVLGARYATDRPESRDEVYRITRQFIDQFRALHGAILCREILGYDISTPEGLEAARQQNIFDAHCPLVVEATARAVARYLDEHPAG